MPIIEAIILYLVLFFPSVFSTLEEGRAIAFSINQELSRIFIYNAPSLTLVWVLLLWKKSPAPAKPLFSPVPRNFTGLNPMASFLFNAGDILLTFIFALSGLLIINISASLANGLAERVTGSRFDFEVDVSFQTPDTAAGWWVLCLSCLSAGYLEESFFRVYLSDRLKKCGFYPAMLMSSVSFAYCHLYEGVFGVVNALLAGLFLFFIFNKRKYSAGMQTLHAIALAHGAYNALVYVAIALDI
ncbi:MAG: CPBP family intramembrane metalloprotease [Treponema sp.]|nr:CPBP family intramembrane metalloprotease [Treponema sp.]